MSRNTILERIRQNSPDYIPSPDNLNITVFKSAGDLKETFAASIRMVGAEFVELNGKEEVDPYIEKHYPGVSDFGKHEIWDKYPPCCSKEDLDQLDIALLEGHFGVAENGAIWLDNLSFSNRLVPFIAQQLIIKLDSKQIVNDMHEAYLRINLENFGFGTFVSGPSKTADIEQSLVYGAHGAKSMLVMIY
jgi:L-lactate dehydrogenase complex protein LldG